MLLADGLTALAAVLMLAVDDGAPASKPAELPAPAARAVDFEKDVRPILTASCVDCHGPDKQEGDLRLDDRESALDGGLSGPAIVPGKSAESRLVRLVAGREGKLVMPPKKTGKRLTDEQIGVLRAWIDRGADWPETAVAAKSTHWAYRAPVRPEPPKVNVSRPGWVRNPIDAFILARLDKEGLTPADEAGRPQLLRRVSLDLTGLPPSVEEVDAFVNDSSPDAYEKAVSKLLASPHYGERWARPWLDLARYADTHGFEKDPRRTAWPYRDWVIEALNDDLPFDRFTVEQIAGDLLPGATLKQKIASGFHRNTMINTEGGVDPEEARVATIVDRVNTTATVWLGSTLACAQCHTHKYDPFQQKEYYQLFAFFNGTDEPGSGDGFQGMGASVEVATPEEIARRDAVRAQIETLTKERDAYLAALPSRQEAWEEGLTPEALAKLSDDVRAALKLPENHRNNTQRRLVADAFRANDPGAIEREATLADLRKREPKFPATMVMKERHTPRETRVMVRGNFLNTAEKVEPGVPGALPPLAPNAPRNRLALARWLVSRENPLTARVVVNRVWEQYFGRGIVGTTEDFGTQGERPTHPELLDWLAVEFMESGWSLKHLHKTIVTSAAYRQSSRVTPEALAHDPDNRLLSRGPRFRMDAEMIRDTALAASGLLSRKVGGPSVFPPQPDGIWTMNYSSDRWVTSAGEDRYRRGLYTFWRRTAPYPTFMAFDAPSRESCNVRRPRTNTPLQALATLNDPAFVETARSLACRILNEGGPDETSRVTRGFRLCLSRPPRPAEVDRLLALYRREADRYQSDPKAAAAMADGDGSRPSPGSPAERAAWTVVANVLLNLDETISK